MKIKEWMTSSDYNLASITVWRHKGEKEGFEFNDGFRTLSLSDAINHEIELLNREIGIEAKEEVE